MAAYVGPADIADANLKLILGLIWTLILNYQIAAGFDEDQKGTPKQLLLDWVNVSSAITGIGTEIIVFIGSL